MGLRLAGFLLFGLLGVDDEAFPRFLIDDFDFFAAFDLLFDFFIVDYQISTIFIPIIFQILIFIIVILVIKRSSEKVHNRFESP